MQVARAQKCSERCPARQAIFVPHFRIDSNALRQIVVIEIAHVDRLEKTRMRTMSVVEFCAELYSRMDRCGDKACKRNCCGLIKHGDVHRDLAGLSPKKQGRSKK